ncbi:MAG: ABC transporter ATP-binding protein [Rubrivivax sp.]
MLQVDRLVVELDAEAGLVRAIDGIRLTLERGETFALVGESGCGKSMTALALTRLLPDNGRVVAGSIQLDGGELLDLPERSMRGVRGGRIGMIFQEPSTSLNPVLRVGQQIVESIEAHTPLRGAAARAKAIEWLGRVGIPEPERRIDEYPFRMSGGQKQRVMIAMTLAAEPDFLIADEPTTALDVTIQAQILALLAELQRERRMGLLLITHDLAVVSGIAHRVALMYAGQVIEVARAEDFFGAPKHPYAQALLRALPDAGQRGRALEAIAGTVPPLSQAFDGCRFAPRCRHAQAVCHTTVPELASVGAAHDVRCLLFVPGAMVAADAGAGPPAGLAALAGVERGAAGSAVKPRPAAVPGAPPLLAVQDLWVRFALQQGMLHRSRVWFDAVRGVNFQLPAGQTLALVGESGCGKTTIGKAIVQLLRGSAQVSGRALLDGVDLLTLQGDRLRDARRRVQMIFQDPFASLNPRMRVFDVLEEGLLSLQPQLDAAARRERIETMVGRVGLRQDSLQRYPHEFSGGQRQRIAIARALAVQPELIVCDEPTSALDVSVQAQILNLLHELQRELGVAYLFITHNIGVVEYIADRVAVMEAGLIVEQGPTAELLGAPQQDYTRTLLSAVPRLQHS